MSWHVLIVDDEKNMRDGIQILIDWDSLDCKVVGAVSNGVEALKLIDQVNVDIVLTDIRMPVMDGLELTQQLVSKGTPMSVIIMSAYRDFEYAQQAIQFNVQNYLVKPIDESKLISTVKKAIHSIEKEMHSRNKPVEDLVKKLVFTYMGTDKEGDLLDRAEQLELKIQDKVFACVQIRFEGSVLRSGRELQIVSEYLHKEHLGYAVTDNMSNIIVLLIVDEPPFNERALMKVLHHMLWASLQVRCRIGIGPFVHCITEIHNSYICTNDLYLMGAFREEQMVVSVRDIHPKEAARADRFEWSLDHMIMAVQCGQYDESLKQLGNLKSLLLYERDMESVLNAYVSSIFRRLCVLDDQIDYHKCMSDIQAVERLEDMIDYMASVVKMAIERIEFARKDANAYLVANVRKLVMDNLSNAELNIKFIAQHLNYNSTYLGRMFSAAENMSIKEYINRKRVETACNALRSSNVSIADLSVELGYRDIGTFYEVFKRIKHVTPKEYRCDKVAR